MPKIYIRWKNFHPLKYYNKKVETIYPENLNLITLPSFRCDVNLDTVKLLHIWTHAPYRILKVDVKL